MIADLPAYLSRHRDRGLMLDTNLMLLWIVGQAGVHGLALHKRTDRYGENDYLAVSAAVERVSRVVVLPNILTETDNLLRQGRSDLVRRCLDIWVRRLGEFDEQHRPSLSIVKDAALVRYGLTDALLAAGADDPLLATDDLKLRALCFERQRAVVGLPDLYELLPS